MFARVTRFKMKESAVDAAKELMVGMKGDVMALPGMKQFINVMNSDGDGYVIALVSDRATSDANAEQVRALWGRFADHLEAMPVPEGYDVQENWVN